jgi:hypothetical protein
VEGKFWSYQVDRKEVVSPKYINIWYQKRKLFVTLTAGSMNNVVTDGKKY